jgi:hypothetical protein
MRSLVFCAATTMIYLSSCSPAMSTSMTEPIGRAMVVTYQNGDSLQIHCSKLGQCLLHLLVNGVKFDFDDKQLNGARPIPVRGFLYSGSFSGRDSYFSFEVSVDCREEDREGPYDYCYATALVEDHKLTHVDIFKKQEK